MNTVNNKRVNLDNKPLKFNVMLVQTKFIQLETVNTFIESSCKEITLKDMINKLKFVDTVKETKFFKRECFIFEDQIYIVARCLSFGDVTITLFEDIK